MNARVFLRGNRRPAAFALLSFAFLGLHFVLVRAVAHGHVAHVLLGSGNAAPPVGAAFLAVALVIVRFVAVVLVPGLLLAAGAELTAYLLVGPPRTYGADEPPST